MRYLWFARQSPQLCIPGSLEQVRGLLQAGAAAVHAMHETATFMQPQHLSFRKIMQQGRSLSASAPAQSRQSDRRGNNSDESARTSDAFLYIGETDCVAEDAVLIGPVSAPDSLLTGKLTGNFADSTPLGRFLRLFGE
jgi:hypothetical protein